MIQHRPKRCRPIHSGLFELHFASSGTHSSWSDILPLWGRVQQARSFWLKIKNIELALKQESRAVARKPRDAAAVLFGLKFTDNIHYKFTPHLTPPLQGTPANIRMNLIGLVPKTRIIGLHLRRWQYGSVFIQIFVVDSERRMYFEIDCVIAFQGHPRSLILAPYESAYATWSSIVTLILLPRFRDSADFLLRRATPPPSHPNFWDVPIAHVVASRSEDPKLIIRVFELVQPCSRYHNRRTDGRTTYDSNTALALRTSALFPTHYIRYQ